ncbi:hypothetical protein BRADI_5g02421v3 [Brachypodium distachyon]|uniref:Uncharacterized protein n=1 Tax=Brachypodium distachyon TaxID=15368 RepID=A0A2K2CF17_BRADI|nr:hypothetical protein BRADI_5g02421v3 [Brachypodium distachyon]
MRKGKYQVLPAGLNGKKWRASKLEFTSRPLCPAPSTISDDTALTPSAWFPPPKTPTAALQFA